MTQHTPDPTALVAVKHAPFNAESAPQHLGERITPNPAFYVRSNFPVPPLDPERHAVAVGGAVERPLSVSVADLQGLPHKTVVTTMECAGNNRLSLAPLPTGEPWSGGAVATGAWTGARLSAVLEQAGLRPDAIEVLVTGADRGRPKDWTENVSFARALPKEKALHPDTILALEMNGAPLPPEHGAPVRLVVPGWYGMASVKWVERIEALTEPFAGYYQSRRYIYDYDDGTAPVPVREMRVKALIASPAEGEAIPRGRVLVSGQAWSGNGEVVRVEVTVDGGSTWQEARLLDPPPSSYAWRPWEFEWEAEEPGRHALRARATDATGATQPDSARWNKYGYGSNGVRLVVVHVV
jgi:DMSO/TMAO reductase YedYZ molybdopterin-dependent catalytic subunit